MVHDHIESEAPAPKKTKAKKKAQENEDEIKIKLKMANQKRNDWKFHIHWNKLEWVNPRIFIERENLFCVFSIILFLKDNNSTAHWVGHSKLKPLYIY